MPTTACLWTQRRTRIPGLNARRKPLVSLILQLVPVPETLIPVVCEDCVRDLYNAMAKVMEVDVENSDEVNMIVLRLRHIMLGEPFARRHVKARETKDSDAGMGKICSLLVESRPYLRSLLRVAAGNGLVSQICRKLRSENDAKCIASFYHLNLASYVEKMKASFSWANYTEVEMLGLGSNPSTWAIYEFPVNLTDDEVHRQVPLLLAVLCHALKTPHLRMSIARLTSTVSPVYHLAYVLETLRRLSRGQTWKKVSDAQEFKIVYDLVEKLQQAFRHLRSKNHGALNEKFSLLEYDLPRDDCEEVKKELKKFKEMGDDNIENDVNAQNQEIDLDSF